MVAAWGRYSNAATADSHAIAAAEETQQSVLKPKCAMCVCVCVRNACKQARTCVRVRIYNYMIIYNYMPACLCVHGQSEARRVANCALLKKT